MSKHCCSDRQTESARKWHSSATAYLVSMFSLFVELFIFGVFSEHVSALQ